MLIKISEKIKKNKCDEPEKLAEILQKVLQANKEDENKEHVWGIYFNSRMNIIRIELISLGILDSAIVHPRECYGPAIESHAASWIAAHNHPSGNCKPSEQDISLTTRLKKAGEIMGVELIDNIIINKEGQYYSFKEAKIIL